MILLYKCHTLGYLLRPKILENVHAETVSAIKGGHICLPTLTSLASLIVLMLKQGMHYDNGMNIGYYMCLLHYVLSGK